MFYSFRMKPNHHCPVELEPPYSSGRTVLLFL